MERRIIWTQKTGASTSDILYPRTVTDNIIHEYEDGSVENLSEYLSNISGKITGFVTLDTPQTITGTKTFAGEGGDNGEIRIGSETQYIAINRDGIYPNPEWDNAEAFWAFPDHNSTGTLALVEDIPSVLPNPASLSITVGSNSAVSYNGNSTVSITIPNASSIVSGIMTATDKKRLDDMYTLFGEEAGDSDAFVDTIREVLQVFEDYPEASTIVNALAGKVSKSGDIMTGSLTVQDANSAQLENSSLTAQGVSVASGVTTVKYGATSITRTGTNVATYELPTTTGTHKIALMSDIPTIPTSLPPNGTAGGDLTGSYPNPTIGTGKVTEEKIANNAVTGLKIASGLITGSSPITATRDNSTGNYTLSIANGAIANAKLDSIATAGTYSAVTVNAQGRVTAGAQLFSTGTSATIPSTVPTNGFYLQYL